MPLYHLKKKITKEKKKTFHRIENPKDKLFFEDAINLNNIIKNFEGYPYGGSLNDVKNSINDILKRTLRHYYDKKIGKVEIDNLLYGIKLGRELLYKSSNMGGFSNYLRDMIKHIERREERFNYLISAIDSNSLSFLDKLEIVGMYF